MHRLKSEQGQTLVEFALILPVMLLILLGVIGFGQAFNQQNDETNMANQAMRYAQVEKCAACDAAGKTIEQYIPTTAVTNSLKASVSVIFCGSPTAQAGDPITVKVTADFAWSALIPNQSLLSLPTAHITSKLTGRLDAAYVAPSPPDTLTPGSGAYYTMKSPSACS